MRFSEKVFHISAINNIPIKAVIHFAGLKSVKESINNPLMYWDINVGGTKSSKNYEAQ